MASIDMENVNVEFPIYDIKARSLRQLLLNPTRTGRLGLTGDGIPRMRALTNVSLSLVDGDRVGLVGANGSGKSTLLRVMAGIYEPFQGAVRVSGKVATLLDLGLGIDPEMTGNENIWMRGLVMGMSPAEMREKVNEIREFTELGESLELPIRTYSSGMMVRLAFAVSTSIRPEIFLIDEVLGVGDHYFMKKAEQRLMNAAGSASIVVVASHSLDALKRICHKGILLDQGRVVRYGPIDEIICEYTGSASG